MEMEMKAQETKRTCGKCPVCFHYGSDCKCAPDAIRKTAKHRKALYRSAPALLEMCQMMAAEFGNEDGIFFERHPHVSRLLDVISEATGAA